MTLRPENSASAQLDQAQNHTPQEGLQFTDILPLPATPNLVPPNLNGYLDELRNTTPANDTATKSLPEYEGLDESKVIKADMVGNAAGLTSALLASAFKLSASKSLMVGGLMYGLSSLSDLIASSNAPIGKESELANAAETGTAYLGTYLLTRSLPPFARLMTSAATGVVVSETSHIMNNFAASSIEHARSEEKSHSQQH